MNPHFTDTKIDQYDEGKSQAVIFRSDHWDLWRVEVWIDGVLNETSWHDTLEAANAAMLEPFV